MWWLLPIILIGLQWLFVTITWTVDVGQGNPTWFQSKRKILCFYIPLFGPLLYQPIVNAKKLPWKER